MAFNFGSTGGAPAFGASSGAGVFGASSASSFGAGAGAGAGSGAGAAPNPFGAAASGAAPSFGGFGATATGGAAGFGAAAAKPAAPAFGAPAAAGGFGATSGAAPAFGAAGAAKPPFGAAPATGSAPALGASAPAFGAGTAAGTAPKPVFGATGTAGFGAATGAASGGGFGFGAAGAKPATTAGFGAAGATTGVGFGAGTGAGTGLATGGGFGAMGTGAGAGAAGAIPNPFGAAGGAGTAASAGAGADLPLPNQHHAEKGLENLVQPIEGMGNFLGSHIIDEIEVESAERKGQPVLSREAAEVFQAINVQFISWNPWDPALLTSNGRLAVTGALRQAVGGVSMEQKANQLQQAQPAEVEKQLALMPQEQQDLVKIAMMPRYDQQTLTVTQNNRNPPDAVENQWSSCEWKPLVDNPHCRFRHYVLQPLTQAQMKLPPDQRHGFNQTASSSPNDPLFQSKLQENPNPYKYCVLPIVGFHQLMRRVRMQDDKLREQNAVLQSFEQEVNRMREFQAVEFPKMLTQRKARQVELGRRTLEVLRRLEMQRQPSVAPSRDLQVLSDMVDQLRQTLSSTLLQRRLQHLEEQMAQLRMQDRRRLKQRSVPSVACDMASLERLDEFLEHRLKGVRHLLDLTRKDLSDANIMRQRLSPAAAY